MNIHVQKPDTAPAPKRDLATTTGMLILFIFLFLRPITVSFHHIGSVSILDLYGIAVSILILLGILINLSKIRLDLISLLILFFIVYCLASFLWGGSYTSIAKTILPFLPFFLTRAVVDDRGCTSLLWVLTLGYIIPVIGSVIMIVLGLSETMITGSMIERQAGLASGVHTLGHLMLFFSFVYALFLLMEEKKTVHKLVMFVIFCGSLFCIYKALTRTVILGGICFWFSHLFFWKRTLFFLVLIVSIICVTWQYDSIKKIITQENAISQTSHSQKVDINVAGSGRIGIWLHNLKLYADLPFTRQLLGVGLGNELKVIPGTMNKKWYGSHNDYMSLLITGGAIGLFIYLILYLVLFFSFITAPVSFEFRLFCLSMLFSVMLMNFVSNSYIVRFQMAQLFWFLIGLLHAKFASVKAKKTDTMQAHISKKSIGTYRPIRREL